MNKNDFDEFQSKLNPLTPSQRQPVLDTSQKAVPKAAGHTGWRESV